MSMVAPNLLNFVSEELERVSAIDNNARELREDQAALKKEGPPPKGGGKGQ